jgi:restriction system protein
MLGGFVKGIFVSTSGYQSGVSPLVQRSAVSCVPIEIIDAKKFYDALGIAQVTSSGLMADVLDTITSRSRPMLHYVADLHRNSI